MDACPVSHRAFYMSLSFSPHSSSVAACQKKAESLHGLLFPHFILLQVPCLRSTPLCQSSTKLFSKQCKIPLGSLQYPTDEWKTSTFPRQTCSRLPQSSTFSKYQARPTSISSARNEPQESLSCFDSGHSFTSRFGDQSPGRSPAS